tara:strand:- start:154 stop:651 length:498 start_codon:yes stop_codon:yes gene_type:complete
MSQKKLNKTKSKSKSKSKSKTSRSLLFKRARVNPSYQPSEDEPFMSVKQRAYFKNKLLDWREELLQETTQTLASLQESTNAAPDLTDRATVESERSLELRTRDRERKLVSKIDQALIRIEEGTYGYCEETDEPIGLRRLQARPIATLSLEAQERHERRERVYRDD